MICGDDLLVPDAMRCDEELCGLCVVCVLKAFQVPHLLGPEIGPIQFCSSYSCPGAHSALSSPRGCSSFVRGVGDLFGSGASKDLAMCYEVVL